MPGQRRRVYEIVEPDRPSWWRANRHKVMFFLGCLVTYLVLHSCNGDLTLTRPAHDPKPAPHSAPAAVSE
ncbi:hypothetical protein [Streptomyces sp. ODS28]|uniref:hypothetical protein n=1 Tax=Streptomyces sp. ODS28 TaxID=3136688 RepID=UPI0031EAF8DE